MLIKENCAKVLSWESLNGSSNIDLPPFLVQRLWDAKTVRSGWMFPALETKDAVNMRATSKTWIVALPEAHLQSYHSQGFWFAFVFCSVGQLPPPPSWFELVQRKSWLIIYVNPTHTIRLKPLEKRWGEGGGIREKKETNIFMGWAFHLQSWVAFPLIKTRGSEIVNIFQIPPQLLRIWGPCLFGGSNLISDFPLKEDRDF